MRLVERLNTHMWQFEVPVELANDEMDHVFLETEDKVRPVDAVRSTIGSTIMFPDSGSDAR